MDPVETPPAGDEVPVVETPPTPEEIAAGADKPDAVSNAIKAEREKAKTEREARLAAEARVKEFEDAQKSEEEKREEALAASKKESDDLREQLKALEVEKLRTKVALDKKLPLGMAGRLTGENIEEIAADADRLLEDLGTLPGETPPPGDGGARTPVPPKDLDTQIREAEAAGDWDTAGLLKQEKLAASQT